MGGSLKVQGETRRRRRPKRSVDINAKGWVMSKSIGLDEKEFAEDCRRDWCFSLAVF